MPHVYVDEHALFVASIRDGRALPAPEAAAALCELEDCGWEVAILRRAADHDSSVRGGEGSGGEAGRGRGDDDPVGAGRRGLDHVAVVDAIPGDESDGWLITTNPERGVSRGRRVRTLLLGSSRGDGPGPSHHWDLAVSSWSSAIVELLASQAMP